MQLNCKLKNANCKVQIGVWAVMLIAAGARGQWVLTTAKFESRAVAIKTIDASAVVTDKENLPWDQVLQLTRENPPQTAGGKFVLTTLAGDQIHGQPAGVHNESLKFASGSMGEISVPLREVVKLSRADASGARGETRKTEDQVALANGDQVSGIISDITADHVAIQSNGNAVTIPLDTVNAVTFAATGSTTKPAARGFKVKLSEGSSISASAVKLSDDRLSMTLPTGSTRDVDAANVASIEQINGPVAWLSGLEPAENVHTPWLDTPRPARMDRAVNGDAIRFGDRTYARGIGVYPFSRLTWTIPSDYAAFRTRYAIDGAGGYANVTVRIKFDGQVIHEKQNFTAGQMSPVIVVPIGGARQITLEVDYGQNFSVQDRFNWIEPALTKAMPEPTTQP